MLTSFRDILTKTARSLGIEPALQLIRVREVWSEVVGATLAGASEPRSLRAGVLVVAAAHPHAAQDVRLRGEEIVRALVRRIPQVGLRQIRVVIRGTQRTGGV